MPSPELTFETVSATDPARLAVSGEIDLATGPSLEEAALALLRDRPGLLILDLRNVTFCDSSGVEIFIRIRKAALDLGCRLQLHHVQELVRYVLDVGGVSQVLGVRDDAPAEPDTAAGGSA